MEKMEFGVSAAGFGTLKIQYFVINNFAFQISDETRSKFSTPSIFSKLTKPHASFLGGDRHSPSRQQGHAV